VAFFFKQWGGLLSKVAASWTAANRMTEARLRSRQSTVNWQSLGLRLAPSVLLLRSPVF
jgi:hypothetical protein